LLLNQLANKLGISITPIREAIKQLEKNELVKVVPNKGAEVVSIFLEDVTEIYDIRSALEGLAIQLLSKKIDVDFLKNFRKLYKATEKYLTKKDIVSYQRCNLKLHESIILKTGNNRLISMMNQIRDHMSIIVIKNLSLEPIEKIREHAKEHIEILHSLEKSDFLLAEQLIKEHIVNAKEEILNNFKGYKKIN